MFFSSWYSAITLLLLASNNFARGDIIIRNLDDRFSYRDTDWDLHVYGPADWDLVECQDVETCPGWPTNWEEFNKFIPHEGEGNSCVDCQEKDDGECNEHKQSPIHLYRNVTANKECTDRHRMTFIEGDCTLDKVHFEVLPHVLRAYQPTCGQQDAVIDFSQGIPVPWELQFTEISVPSQHTQDGKRYDAEVVLSHTYSQNKEDRLVGNVAIFLEKGEESERYPFLDLYIYRWLNETVRVGKLCRDKNGAGNDMIIDPFPEYVKLLIQNIETLENNWQPYDWYVKTGTEYYFRYEGSTPEPPCLQTVHWRVLKDSIKVAPSQIEMLDYLIATHLNPETCQHDTAGKPRGGDNLDWKVDVNRPTQTTTTAHQLVYCECVDWKSRKPSDVQYCKLSMEERGVYLDDP